MHKILICDDEEDIIFALKIYLQNDEYSFLEAHNGNEAIKIVKENNVELVILDVMMPELDGISAMKKIRDFSNVPIIMLTAKSEGIDKVVGLSEGADDYITKPFDPMEVKARVAAQLRRYTRLGGTGDGMTDILSIGGILLDDKQKIVTIDTQPVQLTYTEYEILKLLMQNKGKCYSPKEIYRHIWKEVPDGCERAIAVHIRHLREKIEVNPAEPKYLVAVWGQGYKMSDNNIGDQL